VKFAGASLFDCARVPSSLGKSPEVFRAVATLRRELLDMEVASHRQDYIRSGTNDEGACSKIVAEKDRSPKVSSSCGATALVSGVNLVASGDEGETESGQVEETSDEDEDTSVADEAQHVAVTCEAQGNAVSPPSHSMFSDYQKKDFPVNPGALMEKEEESVDAEEST
ncbi:hypothetical protein U1Q18_049017, partial [Sarracenia purpurea var. burkii]